ncbi:hypothetical protein, partial [Salmonella sp. s55004]|uniref:hypothetical protein n=1 Tax=Salmonella sp. s55004 TaxID=3159675 RepID=UPI00397F9605
GTDNLVLTIIMFVVDLGRGDTLQMGSGDIVGQGIIIGEYNGTITLTDIPVNERTIVTTNNFCWIVFKTNLDRNTGRGFFFQITEGGSQACVSNPCNDVGTCR